MSTFEEAANLINSRMIVVMCPNHLAPGSELGAIETQDGPYLMPNCCCSELAFITYYAFDTAWTSLPESDRPMRSDGSSYSILDTEGMSIEEQSIIRQGFLAEISQALAKVAYCEKHPRTNLTVEIEHEDDGASVFVPHGCCKRFEEAARFFIIIYVRPSLTKG